jgi:7-carboxy-7-deazaguanine synthase
MTRQCRIHEIFSSLQGEGIDTGKPYIFVRFTGCNLSCSYCDTRRARTAGRFLDVDDVVRKVRAFRGIDHVLITGGEPLVQKASVYDLASILLKKGFQVSLETNGSIGLKGIPPGLKIVMDVKTPSSGEAGKNLVSNLRFLRERDEVKFVISDRTDYIWSKNFLAAKKIRSRNVLFSPAWKKLPARTLAEWIMKDRLDVRLQVQLHKILGIK